MAVNRGPHVLSLKLEEIDYAHEEAAVKVKGGFAKIIDWDDPKDNIPSI